MKELLQDRDHMDSISFFLSQNSHSEPSGGGKEKPLDNAVVVHDREEDLKGRLQKQQQK